MHWDENKIKRFEQAKIGRAENKRKIKWNDMYHPVGVVRGWADWEKWGTLGFRGFIKTLHICFRIDNWLFVLLACFIVILSFWTDNSSEKLCGMEDAVTGIFWACWMSSGIIQNTMLREIVYLSEVTPILKSFALGLHKQISSGHQSLYVHVWLTCCVRFDDLCTCNIITNIKCLYW